MFTTPDIALITAPVVELKPPKLDTLFMTNSSPSPTTIPEKPLPFIALEFPTIVKIPVLSISPKFSPTFSVCCNL